MQFIIIERFHPDKVKELYQRFDSKGRLLPEGVEFINSWIDEDVLTCFQLMKADSKKLIEEWVEQWNDLAEFEIFPVIDSDSARKKALGK